MITAMEARKPTAGSGLVEPETVEDGARGREDTEATLTPLHRGVAPCAATALSGSHRSAPPHWGQLTEVP